MGRWMGGEGRVTEWRYGCMVERAGGCIEQMVGELDHSWMLWARERVVAGWAAVCPPWGLCR